RMVVESIEHAAARRVAEAKPIEVARANPFLTASVASAFRVADDAAEGSYEYRMVPSGAASPTEVETDADGAEIKISWGASLLHVEHLDASQSFYAGETA